MFARRSRANDHTEAIHAAARTARTFVFGGDIFDFRWTTLSSIPATVKAATHWLSQLAPQHPSCEFHFVLGNHDYHEEFLPSLADLCESIPNLACHPFYLRLGNSLFLHGDVADEPMTAEAFHERRRSNLRHTKRGPASNLLYDAVVQARLHRLAATLRYRTRDVAQRILDYAEQLGHGPGSGLSNVYFGHTHRALSNYEFGGLRFHNGGAPIKGVPFRIVKTEAELDSGLADRRTPLDRPVPNSLTS